MNHRFFAGCMLPCFAHLSGILYAQTLSLTQEIKNVNGTADTTVNVTLPLAPPAFQLSGTINGPATFFVAVTAQSTDGLSAFSGSVDPTTNKYVVMVTAGTYKLSVSYVAGLSGGASISTFQDPVPVQVNADTVRDITVVPVITHRVSGTISALDSRFSSTLLLFAPADPASGSFGGSPSKLNADGTYSTQLSDGVYSALLSLSSANASRNTSLVLGSVTVSGADVSADFTAPALANLSGTVQKADMSPVPMGSNILGFEGNPFLVRNTTAIPLFSFSSGSIDSASGSYQLVLASGHTYTLGVSLTLLAEDLPQSSGNFFFLLASNTQLAGDTTQDISVPKLPGR